MSSFEYNYWMRLISAIEQYTQQLRVHDSASMLQGNELSSPALEKKLYFEISGSNNYTPQLKTALHSAMPVVVKKNAHKQVLELAFKDLGLQFVLKKDCSTYIKKVGYSNIHMLNLVLWVNYLRARKNIKHSPYRYVFVIIHHKFIRYLAPIYKKLNNSVFLICGDDEQAMQLCDQMGFRYAFLDNQVKLEKSPDADFLDLAVLLEKIKRSLKQMLPARIILPEGNGPIDDLFNLAAQEYAFMQTIAIQHGWSPVYHNGFRKMHFDKFLTWGEEFSTRLKPYNPEQRFIATGNHILQKDQFPDIAQDAVVFFLQTVNSFISQQNYDALLAFVDYIITQYPGQPVIIREHPGYAITQTTRDRLAANKQLRFMNANDYSLAEVLAHSKISVSLYSTVLLESMFYDAVPFIFNPGMFPHYKPDIAKQGLAIEVHDIAIAEQQMDKLLKDGDMLRRYRNAIVKHRNKYFSCYGEQAVDTIVREISMEA